MCRSCGDSQVERVEKENEVFSGEVGQLDLTKLSVDDGQSLEVWCGLLDSSRLEGRSCNGGGRVGGGGAVRGHMHEAPIVTLTVQ